MFFKNRIIQGKIDRFKGLPSYFEPPPTSNQVEMVNKKRKEPPSTLSSHSKYQKLSEDSEEALIHKPNRKRKEQPSTLSSHSKYQKLFEDEDLYASLANRKRKNYEEIPGNLISSNKKRKSNPSTFRSIPETTLVGNIISGNRKRKSDPTAILVPASPYVEVDPPSISSKKRRCSNTGDNKVQDTLKCISTDSNKKAITAKKKTKTTSEPNFQQLLQEIENREAILRKLINHQKAKARKKQPSARALKLQETKKNKTEISRKLLNHQRAKAAREEREREAKRLAELSDILLG